MRFSSKEKNNKECVLYNPGYQRSSHFYSIMIEYYVEITKILCNKAIIRCTGGSYNYDL